MESGNKIQKNEDGTLNVPDTPIIPFIEGDGIGPDIWGAARLDTDIDVAYFENGGILPYVLRKMLSE